MERTHLLAGPAGAALVRMLVFFIPLVLIAGLPGKARAWDLRKEEKAVRVYTRPVEGSGFKEYKGVTRIKAPLSSLVAMVEDVESYPQWIHTCIEGKTLQKKAPTESYAYTVNAAPWPVSDRDAVTRNVVSQNPETLAVTISITGVPEHIPEKPGLVRVKTIKGFWLFTPLDHGSVQIVYQVHNDPGGNIPDWLVNAVVVAQPYRTLLNMHRLVTQPEYREKHYPFINEKREAKPPAIK